MDDMQCHCVAKSYHFVRSAKRTVAFVICESSQRTNAGPANGSLLSRNPARPSIRTLTYAFNPSRQLLVLRRGIGGFVRNLGVMGRCFCGICEVMASQLTPCIFELSVTAWWTHCGRNNINGKAAAFRRHCLSGTRNHGRAFTWPLVSHGWTRFALEETPVYSASDDDHDSTLSLLSHPSTRPQAVRILLKPARFELCNKLTRSLPV